MGMRNTAKNPVRATIKSLEIIEWLRNNESGRVTEIAEDLDIGKGTVHNHLSTLRDYSYVIKEGEEYRLGLKFLEIGGSIRETETLYRIVQPELTSIAERTGELVNFTTEESGLAVVLRREYGEQALDIHTYVGSRVHLHASASGKAILAHLPDQRIDDIIDQWGLPTFTDETITDPQELESELQRIRERGYALCIEERMKSVSCVAAPILGKNGIARGAISITGPTGRLSKEQLEDEFPEILEGVTGSIELQLSLTGGGADPGVRHSPL